METKKEKQVWKNKKIAVLLALIVAVAAFGFTWAFYTHNMALANPLGTSHSGAAMVEEFNPDSSFLPGETVIKKVAFRNTGKMDLFLRVEVPPEEAWYKNGEAVEGKELDENIYDPGKVIKNWKPGVWPENDDEETTEWSRVFTGEVTEKDQAGNTTTVTKRYRYYKKILSPGEPTSEILESITLDPSVSNDRHAVDYSDKIYKLTFIAEAVPVEGNVGSDGSIGLQAGVQGLWSINVSGTKESLVWSE
ncbi:BsaA family SipW-dependent biofilm matrix protein [Lachnospiraceae bacterium 62-35]